MLTVPQLRQLERRLKGFWPPGPGALGTTSALFAEAAATGSRRLFSAFVALDRDNGTKAPVCAWPVSIGPDGESSSSRMGFLHGSSSMRPTTSTGSCSSTG